MPAKKGEGKKYGDEPEEIAFFSFDIKIYAKKNQRQEKYTLNNNQLFCPDSQIADITHSDSSKNGGDVT